MLLRAKTIFLLPDGDSKRTVYPGETVNADENTANELISLGAAVEITRPGSISVIPASADTIPGDNQAKGESIQESQKAGFPADEEISVMDRTYLETLSFTELKEIAKTNGVYSGTMRSKEAVIEALVSISCSDEELPIDLTPQDVVDE